MGSSHRRRGGEQDLLPAALDPALQDGLGCLNQHRLIGLTALLLALAELPLAGKQGVAIQIGKHLIEGDLALLNQATAQEGGCTAGSSGTTSDRWLVTSRWLVASGAMAASEVAAAPSAGESAAVA